MPCITALPSSSTSLCVPLIASGTTDCTSCAKKPSTVVSASAMSNANYCRLGMCGMAANSQECLSQAQASYVATTTQGRYVAAYANTSNEDVPYAGVSLLGDLA